MSAQIAPVVDPDSRDPYDGDMADCDGRLVMAGKRAARSAVASRRRLALPAKFRSLFWDCDFHGLRWRDHRNFIVLRFLVHGGWEDIGYLRERVGDSALRAWILRRCGRGLDPRRLRFWELVLRLPSRDVTSWIQRIRGAPWESRTAR